MLTALLMALAARKKEKEKIFQEAAAQIRANLCLTKEDQVEQESREKGIWCDRCRRYPAVYQMERGERLCKYCAPREPRW